MEITVKELSIKIENEKDWQLLADLLPVILTGVVKTGKFEAVPDEKPAPTPVRKRSPVSHLVRELVRENIKGLAEGETFTSRDIKHVINNLVTRFDIPIGTVDSLLSSCFNRLTKEGMIRKTRDGRPIIYTKLGVRSIQQQLLDDERKQREILTG